MRSSLLRHWLYQESSVDVGVSVLAPGSDLVGFEDMALGVQNGKNDLE